MSQTSPILHVLIAFGAFQALFISGIFLSRGKQSLPKTFFAIFLIIEGVTLIERLLAETGMIDSIPHLLGISYPINFIKPPLFFLMALAIVTSGFKLKRHHLWHLIPFGIILITNIPFYLQPGDAKLAFVESFLTTVPDYDSFGFYLSLSFFFYIGIYMALSIKQLRNYRLQIKGNRLVNWYLNVLQLYSLGLILGLMYYIIRPSGIIEIPMFNIISMLVMTFLVQSVAYRFFTEGNIFQKSSSSLTSDMEKLARDQTLIKNKLEKEKLFLEDDLTLEEFSKHLGLPKKYVSDLVNQHFGQNFRDLINRYRVEEAKSMMKQMTDSKIQLIEIGLESGFNNKVSFYRAFKKYTGKSPSDYLESLKSIHSE